MRDAGMSAEQSLAALQQVKVVPVFTAHPTEVARRTVLTKRRRIAKFLELLDRLPMPAPDALEMENAIAAEITALWQTDEVRVQKPQVTDEIRMGLDHYPMSIFESLPRLYSEIRESFKDVYGMELCAEQVPAGPYLSAHGSEAIATATLSSRRKLHARRWNEHEIRCWGTTLPRLSACSNHCSASSRQVPVSPGISRAAR